ncbi:MAG: 3-phosphoshikimate 1-carboxyvinyltransferase [Bacteroidetes bacterium]|nr:MAG: 3-phosphoshikimate 1-carboxyvinyltransferase [Bacteroidota bacterium]
MTIEITPSAVKGQVQAPASKSVAQRAVAIASLASGTSEIFHVGKSDDVQSAIRVCQALGAEIEQKGEKVIVKGGIQTPSAPLNCGESGLGIRMFSALAAILNEPVTLTGEGSLKERPMQMIEESLQAAGVQCETQNGLIPVVVKGPLKGGIIEIDGSLSSQVLTGLLIAAPYAISPVTFRISDLKSRPYVDITTAMMRDFGVVVQNKDYEEFVVPAPQKYVSKSYTVEGDWSGAAFLLVAGAIAGEVAVTNLDFQSSQADKEILTALKNSGAELSVDLDRIFVKKAPLKAFRFDATHCPDLFPPLVVLAAACDGISQIRGVSRLRSKESDRATALQQEFGKLGLYVSLEGDNMLIKGNSLNGGRVFSHSDHRIAMACAVAGLIADGPVIIDKADAVNKSYPEFFKDLGVLCNLKFRNPKH